MVQLEKSSLSPSAVGTRKRSGPGREIVDLFINGRFREETMELEKS